MGRPELITGDPDPGQPGSAEPLQPLTARSIVLSTLLGYHPPALPVSALVRVTGLFGVTESATRAALSRLVAAGDLIAGDGVYELSARLVRRQREQEESAAPALRPWTGQWEMAVVTGPARPLAARVALRRAMTRGRLAELREGVWLRPDNLDRPADGMVAGPCAVFRCEYPDSGLLAGELWDLPGWAAGAREVLAAMDRPARLADGFVLIARAVRQLQLDPCLPGALLPPGWPGPALRDRFSGYRDDFARRLRDYSAA